MLRQSEEILQDAGVYNLLILDEIIEKKLEHNLLSFDILYTGRAEPTVLLEVSQLDARIKIREKLPEPYKIFIISLDGEVEWLHFDSIHHIVWHQKGSANDFMSFYAYKKIFAFELFALCRRKTLH